MTDPNQREKKRPGRFLGLDLGTKTIGIAASDPAGTIASSAGVIKRKGVEHDLARIREIVEEREVVRIVLGLPLHLDGRESEGSRRSREFKRLLEERLGLPVSLADESLSTSRAEDVLLEADLSRQKRKKVIDGLAAQVILQSYLDELKEEGQR